MLARAVGMADVADGGEQLQEERPVAGIEDALFGAHTKDDFLAAAERRRFGAHAGAGKFQASPAKGKFGGGKHGDLAVGQDGLDSGDRVGEPFERCGLVGRVDQAGGDVAAVRAIDFQQRVVALVQFKQTPLGGRPVQIGHALADERGTAVRHKQVETLDQELTRRGQPAHFEPEDAKGEGGIDGGLSLRRVDSQDREGRLALAQEPAGVDRAKGFLQVDGGGQPGDGEAGEVAFQGATQFLLVAWPGLLFWRRGSGDRARGKFPAWWDATARGAGRPASGCRFSPRRRARGGRCCARPTRGAAGICCTRRKSSTWRAPDRRRPRRPRARLRRRLR